MSDSIVAGLVDLYQSHPQAVTVLNIIAASTWAEFIGVRYTRAIARKSAAETGLLSFTYWIAFGSSVLPILKSESPWSSLIVAAITRGVVSAFAVKVFP